MMLAARGIFLAARRKKGWANPYVTDGLVAYWDGEWNAGGGVHDESTTDWYDLTGNGHKLHAPSPIWGDAYSAVNTEGTKESKFRATAAEAVWFKDLIATGRYTIELHTSNRQALDAYILSYGVDNFMIRGFGYTSGNTGSYFRLGGTSYYSRGGFAVGAHQVWSASCDGTACVQVINGSEVSATGTFSAVLPSYGFVLGARGDLYSNQIGSRDMKYHRISVYSRPLTAAEIAANYAVDKARFNLPDAT